MARGFSPMSLVPEIPDPREFSTNEVMGHSADRLCEAWGVSRQEQVRPKDSSKVTCFRMSLDIVPTPWLRPLQQQETSPTSFPSPCLAQTQ